MIRDERIVVDRHDRSSNDFKFDESRALLLPSKLASRKSGAPAENPRKRSADLSKFIGRVTQLGKQAGPTERTHRPMEGRNDKQSLFLCYRSRRSCSKQKAHGISFRLFNPAEYRHASLFLFLSLLTRRTTPIRITLYERIPLLIPLSITAASTA